MSARFGLERLIQATNVSLTGVAGNRASAYDVEDNIVMHWHWTSRVLGTASWNFSGFDRNERIEVVGMQGRLTLSVFGNRQRIAGPAIAVPQLNRPNTECF